MALNMDFPAPDEGAKEKKSGTRNSLEDLRKTFGAGAKDVKAGLRNLADRFKAMDRREKAERVAQVGTLALVWLMEKPDEPKENEEENTEAQADEDTQQESSLFQAKAALIEGEENPQEEVSDETELESNADDKEIIVGEPQITKTKKSALIEQDHTHNARLLKLLPQQEEAVNKFMDKFRANQERYQKVGQKVGLPPILIAALHYRESGMQFDRYLHNGDPLGSVTTHVPAGILFDKGQWEEAATHALGGSIKDKNGKPSLQRFQTLRTDLGIDEKTTDMGKLMTFAEYYNGLGYRFKSAQSAYVYAGTNLATEGMFVADGKFDRTKSDKRLGISAMLMGGLQKKGEPLHMATEKDERIAINRERKVSVPRPSGIKAMKQSEVTTQLGTAARRTLDANAGKPYGTVIPLEGDVVALIDQHYHKPGGPKKPWGYHKGVTLFHRINDTSTASKTEQREV